MFIFIKNIIDKLACESMVFTYFVISAILVALQIISEYTGNWLLVAAKSLPIFVVFNIIFLLLIILLIHGVTDRCFATIWIPGQFLVMLQKRYSMVQNESRYLISQGDSMTKRMKIATLYATAYAMMVIMRRKNIAHYFFNLLCIISLFSMHSIILSAYFGCSTAFKNINACDGLIRHLYFITVTMVTVGYGDIFPANWYGYIFTIIVCFTSIYLLMIGVGFIVSQLYYLTSRLESDIRDYFELYSNH